jgi:hypothetical protein
VSFTLPEEMPTGVDELNKLHVAAKKELDRIAAKFEKDKTLSDADLEYLEYLGAALETIDTAITAAEEETVQRNDKIANLLKSGEPVDDTGGADDAADDETADDENADADDETDDDDIDPDAVEVIDEAEQVIENAGVTAAGKRPVSFKGMGKGKSPQLPARRSGERDFGFTMDPQAPGYKPGFVGFKELAEGVDSVRTGRRVRSNRPNTGSYAGLTLGRLKRAVKAIDDPHELYAEIERATAPDQWRAPKFDKQGRVAAGGWCAPSETLYDFCETPTATDLVSLPEFTINRGGVRWPDEPDLTALFEDFEWFFTEPQLEAVDGSGNPTAIKECVDIPCVETFTEIRLNAVGYCVEAGILQTQGWPELIAKFMAEITQEHFRALSRRTINDMVTGSTALAVPDGTGLGVASAVLNAMALMATNLRLDRGLGRTALIEAVAPSFLLETMRADLAMRDGVEALSITDAQLMAPFAARNIALQLVGDWQTRGPGQPGNMGTTFWPDTVNVLMYPAGTWFRSLSNVIELGVLYPKELLQVNRYTRMFTEDAIAVAKRCGKSLNIEIPICPSGAIGQRQTVVCNSPTVVNEAQRIATATGTITAGTFPITFNGQTATGVAWNASAAAVKTKLDSLSNLDTGDTIVTGGPLPGTPVDVEFTGAYAGVNVPTMSIDSTGLTGGTLGVTATAQGHS